VSHALAIIPISLDDLPRHSRWPAILLGRCDFAPRRRTSEEVLREYEREKWGTVLAWLRASGPATADDLLREQGIDPEQIVAFAEGRDFFTAPARHVMGAYDRLLRDTLLPCGPERLVELGCGLGDKLLMLSQALRPAQAYGGEFTRSGVECGRLLAAARQSAAHFDHFDYNDPRTLDRIPERALVYTSHSIEQIPTLPGAFVDALIARAPSMVVHFEPCYEDQDTDSVIGLMRRRYTELNDYNRNLLALLRSFADAGRITIVGHSPNVFSDTPFNTTSVISWVPA
jgi:hypothetical protein